jgi:hypothetical protein
MFLIKFPMVGSKLISIPYDAASGGVLTTDQASERFLIEHAATLAQKLQVNYLQLRYGSERMELEELGLQSDYPVIVSEMELNSESTVWSRVAKHHRRAIKTAKKKGVTVREVTGFKEFIDFYNVYLRIFRNFGTPPYGGTYFPTLWRRFSPSGSARLLAAYIENQFIGGMLLFGWGSNLIMKFVACLPEAVPMRAYAALYWRAIQLGLQTGYQRLSWGTSSRDQIGLIKFKERWGAQSHPVGHYSLSIRGRVPPLERYYDSEGITRRMWRFQPLWTTRVLGGLLNRWFC